MEPLTALIGGLFGLAGSAASKPKRSPLEQAIARLFLQYSPQLADAYTRQAFAPGLSPQSQALANALNADTQRAGDLATRQTLLRTRAAGFDSRGTLASSALAAALAGLGNTRLQQMVNITAGDQAQKNAALASLQALVTGQAGNALNSYDHYASLLGNQQQNIINALTQLGGGIGDLLKKQQQPSILMTGPDSSPKIA
ncbi:MAG: hypothetical protein ACYC7E_22975 [Armatimonadota bacterium]